MGEHHSARNNHLNLLKNVIVKAHFQSDLTMMARNYKLSTSLPEFSIIWICVILIGIFSLKIKGTNLNFQLFSSFIIVAYSFSSHFK